MFKIIHNMTACYCTNPITEVAEGREYNTQIDNTGDWNHKKYPRR